MQNSNCRTAEISLRSKRFTDNHPEYPMPDSASHISQDNRFSNRPYMGETMNELPTAECKCILVIMDIQCGQALYMVCHRSAHMQPLELAMARRQLQSLEAYVDSSVGGCFCITAELLVTSSP
jgi:hypothetical protein